MRDPFNLAIPLFRAFGIQVKLHILYIIVTLGMIGRAYQNDPKNIGEFILIWVVMLFCIILLHEFGHCFAARKVEGEADEILMWPLGGLAFCNVPQTVRANLWTVLGGPLVNVIICAITAAALFAVSYLPPINPFQTRQLYYPELHNWNNGKTAIPDSKGMFFISKKDGRMIFSYKTETADDGRQFALTSDNKIVEVEAPTIETYPSWVLWTARLFWLSWVLLLFNLIPAYPMDGGRILQCILWGKMGDYRRSTTYSCFTGIGVAMVFLLISFWFNDSMLVFLAVFIVVTCYQQLIQLDRMAEENGPWGYDFSKGYGGFGPEDEPQPKKLGYFARRRLARLARKQEKEALQKASDDRRLDELLEKISREGKDSLTPDEQRFMARVSNRYRNKP